MTKAGSTPDGRAEYDFSGGTRGRYAERYRQACNVVVLDPDVAAAFPDSAAANAALREYIAVRRGSIV